MSAKNKTAPYIHTNKNDTERIKDWAVALLPVIIWSVFMFGGRALMLCLIGAAFSLGFDFLTRAYIFKIPKKAALDFMACIYGALAVLTMPVTVPLFAPIVSSALVTVAKNLKILRGKRLFNPYIFSAAVMNLAFPKMMTAFTKPFAYFSAFDFVIDQRLMDNYRVLSPLQFTSDGSIYEDGVFAQLYGFASGNMGEIAVMAMLISLIYLVIRKNADLTGVFSVLFPILILGLSFPSNDAESSYYAFSIMLTGGIAFVSVFAMNEKHTVPLTFLGKIVFGGLLGILIFVFRKVNGSIEFAYYIVLALNLVSPFIELYTRPSLFDKIDRNIKTKLATKKAKAKDEK